MKRAGAALLILICICAAGAPWLAPNDPDTWFPDLMYAPPTRMHLGGGASGLYIYAPRLVSRLERRFEEDQSRPVRLRFFRDGRLVTADPRAGAPLLLLGADGYGRDVLARLLHGARTTLAVAVIATIGAALLGAVIGGLSAQSAGWVDAALSRFSEFVLVLPTIYVALALRAVMPLIVPTGTVFLLLTGIFTLLGWPIVARGVRAIVLSERQRDYVLAARAAGAGPIRLLLRHLLPANTGITAAACVHPRRGDDVVCRARVSAGCGDLGDDAAGRRQRGDNRHHTVDTRPGPCDLSGCSQRERPRTRPGAASFGRMNSPRPLAYGTSIRIVPSCRDVTNSSPSLARLMCRSARVSFAPIVFSTSSWNVTLVLPPLESRTNS